jgi:UDP-N-acetylmuramate dehydrogenase
MTVTNGASGAIREAETTLRAACGPRLRTSFPLAPLTTFRIGGPAALYLDAERDADLEAASIAVQDAGIGWAIIGKGSNVLVADDGFNGLVIRLGKGFRWASRDGTRLHAGGSMPLPALAGVALSHSLAGLEFGVAIPATLGGAVRMNAGAHGRSMQEVIHDIDVFSMTEGRRRRLTGDDVAFAYRRASLPEGSIVVGATASLAPGDRETIRAGMDEAREWRRATQPLAEPNCGSVFKNPPGDFAARLIDAAGGKELSVGGAEVSKKHANFIVARPGATAADVRRLVVLLQETVEEKFGIRLEPEVQLVGDFDRARL